MQLKEYQQRAPETIRGYLELLASWRKKAGDNPDLPAKAWEKAGLARRNLPAGRQAVQVLADQFNADEQLWR